ncbi:MAG TPA: hypothetical protein PLC79_03560, partial [Phycisphaerae bacterium]|nr:hypothetical protein [Phycisphaerae bacterium]
MLKRLASCRILPAAAALAFAAVGCANRPARMAPASPDDPGNPLVCRLANYGKYQDAAWSHLPSIGIRYVFMNVPAP